MFIILFLTTFNLIFSIEISKPYPENFSIINLEFNLNASVESNKIKWVAQYDRKNGLKNYTLVFFIESPVSFKESLFFKFKNREQDYQLLVIDYFYKNKIYYYNAVIGGLSFLEDLFFELNSLENNIVFEVNEIAFSIERDHLINNLKSFFKVEKDLKLNNFEFDFKEAKPLYLSNLFESLFDEERR